MRPAPLGAALIPLLFGGIAGCSDDGAPSSPAEVTSATAPDAQSADALPSFVYSDAGPMDPGSPPPTDAGPDDLEDSVTPPPDPGAPEDAGPAPDEGDPPPPPPPDPSELTPCANGSCWDTAIQAAPCSSTTIPEDFSTGKYNVHAYDTQAPAGVPLRLRLTVTGGDWAPAIVVTRSDGTVLSDGATPLVAPGIEVTITHTGADGGPAELELTSELELGLVVYVTGWTVLSGDFAPGLTTEATYTLQAKEQCPPPEGGLIAPPGAGPGGDLVTDGSVSVPMGAGDFGPAVRVDAAAAEHVGFRLDFGGGQTAVKMQVLAWTGSDAVSLGTTTEGPIGKRFLAARDPDQPRTFWARASSAGGGTATLTVSRTIVGDHPPCPADCGALLQLPLPVAADLQGYGMPSGVVYAEQFGRRDSLIAIFHAGRNMAALGYAPFTLKDLSNWDGSKPPGHETHNDGFHADVSLYDTSGKAVWKALCTASSTACTGPPKDFGATPMALLVGGLFETGIVSSILLDKMLIPSLRDAADELLSAGLLSSEGHALIQSNALRHVNYHHHHIHMRTDGK